MSKPKPKPDTFTGTTLAAWQANLENVRWAASEPRVRMLLSVALHGIEVVAATTAGMSEGRAYGNVEGAFKMLNLLRACTDRPERLVPQVEEELPPEEGLPPVVRE